MRNVQLFFLLWLGVGSVFAQNYPPLTENTLCDERAAAPTNNELEYNIWLRPMHCWEKSPGEFVYLAFDFVVKRIPSKTCRIRIEPVVDAPIITTGTATVTAGGFETLGFTLAKPGQVTQVRFKIEDYVSGRIVFEKILNIQETFTTTSLKLLASDPHGAGEL